MEAVKINTSYQKRSEYSFSPIQNESILYAGGIWEVQFGVSKRGDNETQISFIVSKNGVEQALFVPTYHDTHNVKFLSRDPDTKKDFTLADAKRQWNDFLHKGFLRIAWEIAEKTKWTGDLASVSSQSLNHGSNYDCTWFITEDDVLPSTFYTTWAFDGGGSKITNHTVPNNPIGLYRIATIIDTKEHFVYTL